MQLDHSLTRSRRGMCDRRGEIPNASCRRKAARSRQRRSTMRASFELFKKLADVVEAHSRPEFAQVLRFYLEWRRSPTRPPLRAGAECLVDHLFEGLTCAPRLRPQLGFHVVV